MSIYLAIDLIKHLLQVKRRRRLTVEKALLHNYFQVRVFLTSHFSRPLPFLHTKRSFLLFHDKNQ